MPRDFFVGGLNVSIEFNEAFTFNKGTLGIYVAVLLLFFTL